VETAASITPPAPPSHAGQEVARCAGRARYFKLSSIA
jgi:hypothetical protein